jgi:hypothetical protein
MHDSVIPAIALAFPAGLLSLVVMVKAHNSKPSKALTLKANQS